MPALAHAFEYGRRYLMENAESGRILLIIAVASLLFCTAVNCYTYRLAYPLWQWVGPAEFSAVHENYLRLLTPVITAPHIVMFFSTAGLLYLRPTYLPFGIAMIVFVCSTTVITISIAGAGPVHSRFERTGQIDMHGLSRLHWISAVRSGLLLGASILLFAIIAGNLPA